MQQVNTAQPVRLDWHNLNTGNRDTLAKLARQGSLVRYPPLVEEEGVMVTQTEHSMYVGPDGVEILTTC